MQRIEFGDYPNVRALFEPLRYNLAVDSILAGNTHGRVYADDAQQPNVALIWNEMEAILLAGDPDHPAINDSFRWLLHHEMEPLARAKGVPGFNFHITSDWEGFIAIALADCNLQRHERRFHRLGTHPLRHTPLPSGYHLQRIDAALLDHSEMGHIEQVLGWVYSFWPSIEGLMEHGLGYCAVRADIIASWCLSVYASGQMIELGVATAPEFRNQGLATCVAAACVNECQQKGVSPIWHCDTGNFGSVAIAAKVGFVPLLDYVVYHFDFPKGEF